MKKIKVSVLAVAAILLGIFGSAFTTAKPANNTLDGWFIYNGSGALDNPASYAYNTSIAPCSDHISFCAMKGNRQASPNQNRPTQQSLDDASTASNAFANEVTDLVVFKP